MHRRDRSLDIGGGTSKVKLRAVGANAYTKAIFERRQILIIRSEKPDGIGEGA